MSQQTQVTTEVSVGTKVVVAMLILGGLGALGYASGFVKLDYQSANAVADAAAEQCDCFSECAEEREQCLKDGNDGVFCDQNAGACLGECLPPQEPPVNEPPKDSSDQCTDQCKVSFDSCIASGESEEVCLDKGAACMCECDPLFAPMNIDNSCADSCRTERESCEADLATNSSLRLDCSGREYGCLNECQLWCDDLRTSSTDKPEDKNKPEGSSEQKDPNAPNGNGTTEESCEDVCRGTFDQCQANGTAAGSNCQGQLDGCLRECKPTDTPPEGQPNGSVEDAVNPNDGSVSGNGATVGGDIQ
ncbi:hypothetical protein CO174_02290 [Candidatus Uhrbacteria bacterium CG_4_9_14_3_um_filter_50_9]|uniref:Uncharacterized protein n=1 Tax=Candidatus Uhrbacteria bacterium CG_4_9_14_3_um_filter_50_9 TaxID=1975035 RepID=A0A2M7XCL1_9BACT|nr:MAG: hypothetical protein CO174_02290 [Candidatus Uhrbacteria bacterium CG_4_9_14_3_um_filter_50_9]